MDFDWKSYGILLTIWYIGEPILKRYRAYRAEKKAHRAWLARMTPEQRADYDWWNRPDFTQEEITRMGEERMKQPTYVFNRTKRMGYDGQ